MHEDLQELPPAELKKSVVTISQQFHHDFGQNQFVVELRRD